MVQHPDIIRTYGYVKNGDSYYLVTQYTESVNLEQLINDPRVPWSWEMFITIALNVANAMRCLHFHHLAHLDLDATSVLVTFPRGSYSPFDGSQGPLNIHAVLCSFGMTLTQYDWINKQVFAALKLPEPSPINEKRYAYDVGNFGLLLQRMLTRRYDWGGLSDLQKRIKFVAGDRPPLPGIC